MSTKKPPDPTAVLQRMLSALGKRLQQDKRLVRLLPQGGRLMMDRSLPFICLYRAPAEAADPGVDELVRAQTSYLRCSDAADYHDTLRSVLSSVATAVTEQSQAFLIIEIWPADPSKNPDTFKAMCPVKNLPATSRALSDGLNEMVKAMRGAKAEVIDTAFRHPPHLHPLFSMDELRALGVLTIGVEVPLLYWSTDGRYSHLAFRVVRNKLTEVIKRTVFAFIRVQTKLVYPHYLTLGRRNLSRLALSIDRRLTRIGASFDVLLNVTPVNTEHAWQAFERSRYETTPDLHYRLIPVDPDRVKRELFQLRIGEVEDNALEFIFRDKRNELETQLTLLNDRGTRNFLYGSLRLHGSVEPRLLQKAQALIASIDRLHPAPDRKLDATAFAVLVEKELEHYRPLFPGIPITVRVRNDVDGVLVSKGQVHISELFTVDAGRAHALLQHEVGTHVLTYCNGRMQPLQQLSVGLAGYDQLQEGLAVLAEYLCGGLSAPRLRLVAARVVAVHAMVQGASFQECFRLLMNNLGYPARQAYGITVRVFRGGGFAKDAAYLRGLDFLLDHLHKAPEHLDLLYTGKFGIRHIQLIEDLHHRGVLHPPVFPPFLDAKARARVAALNGTGLEQLLHSNPALP